MRAALLLLALTSSAFGQVLELDAPDSTNPGELVVLDASAIPSAGRTWQAVNAPPESFRVVDNGERLIFATPRPGRYWFVFSFTEDSGDLLQDLADVQQKLLSLSRSAETAPTEVSEALDALAKIVERLGRAASSPRSITHELVVEGDPLPDDPDNPPTPQPLPDGRYKLASLSRAEARKLPDTSAAALVAGVYRAVAAQVQAGALKGDRAILTETSQKLRDRLGDKFDQWKPWGIAISERLSELYESGDMVSDEQFATAYGEIALGLEALP